MSEYWEKLKERAKSTKFQLMLAGVVTTFFAWRTGEGSTEVFIAAVTALISFWISGQARVDAAERG